METEQPPKVFFSYSHDSEVHKDWVLRLATRLRSNGIDVVLDRWNLKLGNDLPYFMEQGLSKSSRVVCVCSEDYNNKANQGEGGVAYEKHILTAKLVKDVNTSWIIPLIRNNKSAEKLPTFLGAKYYISFENDSEYESKYEELLRELLDESILPLPPIGPNPFQQIRATAATRFKPSKEKYLSPTMTGTITFDYSNNNGRFIIGQGDALFETAWSKASNTSIYAYSDPPSIHSLALVLDKKSINEITDAEMYDFTSRVRTPQTNEIVIWYNKNGYFAATKILNVKDRTRGDGKDELTLEYVILTNGSGDFSK